VNWRDTRTSDAERDLTIEVFTHEEAMAARARFAARFSDPSLTLGQYVFAEPRLLAVLRIPHTITQQLAAEYERWFRSLAE
jgi:hypothetical protein